MFTNKPLVDTLCVLYIAAGLGFVITGSWAIGLILLILAAWVTVKVYPR